MSLASEKTLYALDAHGAIDTNSPTNLSQPNLELIETGDELTPLERCVPIKTITGIARIAGAKVQYNLHTPLNESDLCDNIPVYIAHGYMGPESAYIPLAQTIAQSGKPAITHNAPRTRGYLNDIDPRNYYMSKVAKFNSQVAWSVLRDVKENFNYQIFDAYGHSMGGQTVVNLAVHKPENIRSVILDSSNDLHFHNFEDSLDRAIKFLPKELWPSRHQLIKNCGPNLGKQALHYIDRNPALTLIEGLNAGATNLQSRLSILAQKEIGRAIVLSKKDIFSPAHKVIRDSGHLFNLLLIRSDPEANHLAPQLFPKETAQIILHLLKALNQPELVLVT